MAKNSFNNLNDLYKAIEKEVGNSIENVIDNYVIPTLVDVIWDEVYMNPEESRLWKYRRRKKDHGLWDERNIKYTMEVRNGVFYINVRNHAQIYTSTHGRTTKHTVGSHTWFSMDNSNSYVHEKNKWGWNERKKTESGEDARYYLDRLIVDGAGHNQQPRDFYKKAQEIIEKEFPRVLARELKARGIDVDLNVNIESHVFDKDFLEAGSEHWRG